MIATLNHQISWPTDYPENPPKHLQYWVGNRRDTWQHTVDVLWLVSQGFSVGREIQYLLGLKTRTDPTSGAIKRLLPKRIDAGLLTQSMPRITQHRPVRLVKLDHMGYVILRELGWETVETEWERMQRLHEKGKRGEQMHTLSVLWFTWNARLRGYRAGVMPHLDNAGRFAPDVLIENVDGQQIFVEVERRKAHLTKWENMLRSQGFIALCARTPDHRRKLVAQIRMEIGGTGMATDIQTLLRETWREDGSISSLWVEEW